MLSRTGGRQTGGRPTLENGGVEWVDEDQEARKKTLFTSLGKEDLKVSRWILGPRDGGKIVELRAALSVLGAVRLIHPMTKSQVKSSQVDTFHTNKK